MMRNPVFHIGNATQDDGEWPISKVLAHVVGELHLPIEEFENKIVKHMHESKKDLLYVGSPGLKIRMIDYDKDYEYEVI